MTLRSEKIQDKMMNKNQSNLCLMEVYDTSTEEASSAISLQNLS